MLRNWAASFSVPLSVFRLQNVYGPGQSPHNPYTGIITLFHRLASRGETLDVYEDGEISRDFVFIDDVVAALVAGSTQPPGWTSASSTSAPAWSPRSWRRRG